VVSRRQVRVGHPAGASATLAADVHRVAQVPAGGAVTDVIVGLVGIVILAGNGVGSFVGWG